MYDVIVYVKIVFYYGADTFIDEMTFIIEFETKMHLTNGPRLCLSVLLFVSKRKVTFLMTT